MKYILVLLVFVSLLTGVHPPLGQRESHIRVTPVGKA